MTGRFSLARASLALALGCTVLAGCAGPSVPGVAEGAAPAPTAPLDRPSPPALPTPAPGRAEVSPRAELEAIARGLLDGDNAYLGMAPLKRLEQARKDPGLVLPERYRIAMELCQLYVREGRTEEAVALCDEGGRLLDEMLPRLASNANDVLATYHQARATAYMRHAENTNCVARHGPESCVLPVRGAGVHTVKEPGREALKSWLELHRRAPGDLLPVWLANVVAMTIAEPPGALPAELRLDFSRNQSKARVPEFRDVAPQLGLNVFNMAGGTAVEDYDGDGLLDVVMSTSDPMGSMLYFRNAGDGSFVDAAPGSGLDQQLGGLNVVTTDHDGDGDPDLLVLRGGWLAQDGRIRKSLLRNDGQGRFEDVTRAAGLAEPAFPTQTGVWADFDNDGDLDLYVGNEVSVGADGVSVPYPCQLFRNQGDGTFVEMADAAGVRNDLQAKGVAAGDYDNDGDLDLYVSNIGPNRLYRNEGAMRFVDVAVAAGVVEPSLRSFAPWFFDYDNDGHLDLWVPAYDATPGDLAADLLGKPVSCNFPRLYRNRGDGTFTDVAETMGLAHPYRPMGANFGDIDNDGWLDLYLGTGAPEFTYLMPNVMLRNDRARRFQDVTAATRLGHLQKGHGIAFADLDHDGDQDIVHQLGGFVHGDRFRNSVFLNTGKGGRFLYVSLKGTKSNRPGIGARIEVEVETPSGVRVIRRAAGAVSSFGGSSLFRQEIGLGDAKRVRALRVWWPTSGVRQSFSGVPLDAHVEVREDAPEVRRLPLKRIPIVAR